MTIPLDNLYDYIFSLTGHNNKNLIMYRFSPHGSKNIKNLITHNNANMVYLQTLNTKNKKQSWHHKLLFCYDQEPLNFDLYAGDFFYNERKELFSKQFPKEKGVPNIFSMPFGQKIIAMQNIAGHPEVQDSVYDKKLLLHSELSSEDLKKYEKCGFIGIYYWCHAFIALDWYRFAKHDKFLNCFSMNSYKKDFNIYCQAWEGTREYRLKFLSMLSKVNIDQYSNIFFNEYGDNEHFTNYQYSNKKWQLSSKEKKSIEQINCILNKNSNPNLSAVYTPEDYKESAIDVVLETVFDKNKIQLTEKILRPIACGKPFILLSEKNSLKYLRSYGFKTFNNLIDESYDKIGCPKKRLKSIVNVMKSISMLSKTEKIQLFFEMHKIAEQNKKWFFSEDFFNIINAELRDNLKNGLESLNDPSYQTAKILRVYYRANRRYMKYMSFDEKRIANTVVNEYPERIELSKKNIGKY